MKRILISAADGFELSALYATPVELSCNSVVISSAAGIKKEYYIPFAEYLIQHGYNVLLYDYRGVGGSVARGIEKTETYMHEWGILDMNAVLNYMIFERGQRDIIWIGHCIGAQLAGFLRNTQYVKKVIAVNAAAGYWRYLPLHRRLMARAFSFMGCSLILKLYGYGSLRKEGLDGDLPKNVFIEWQKWCKSKNYYRQFLTEKYNTDKFYSFRTPVISVYTSDDYMANEKTARFMLSFFPNAPTRIIKLQVEQFMAHNVGHLGIFCKKFHRDLWTEFVGIIES